uniref:Tektin n=1 Tax=Malurus cyaneus samueli TaxID=2593467 RepID=A0A8C5TQA9_9PASS
MGNQSCSSLFPEAQTAQADVAERIQSFGANLSIPPHEGWETLCPWLSHTREQGTEISLSTLRGKCCAQRAPLMDTLHGGMANGALLFGSLVQEVNEINETLRNLHQCLRASEDMLQMLVRSKGVLEYDLVVKNNSLFIDQERCMGMRKSYPSTVQILGYVSAGLT